MGSRRDVRGPLELLRNSWVEGESEEADVVSGSSVSKLGWLRWQLWFLIERRRLKRP